MNREQAEKLLAALIFNDLDETSKAELTAYLQTDDELRYRLADLRMAVKLADDAVNEGPDPVLGEQRLKQLKRLAKADKINIWTLPVSRPLAVAAVLIFALVFMGLLMPSLSKTRRYAATTASKSRSYAYRVPPDAGGVSTTAGDVSRPAPASRPATRGAPSGAAPPATRTPAVSSYDMYVQKGAGMGGMASDKKGTSGTGGMTGGMGDTNGDMVGKQIATIYGASERNRDMYAGVKIQDQQAAASDAPATSRSDVRSLMPLPPAETARDQSSNMQAGKEVLEQQLAIARGRLHGDLESSSPGRTPPTRFAETIRGSKVEVTELDMAKEVANKLRMESESTMRSGRGVSDKEVDAGGGIYQGPRQEAAAKTPDGADMANIAGAVGYGETVSYAWPGKVAPQSPVAPVITPAPSAPVAADVKKSDRDLNSWIPGSWAPGNRTPLLGDIPLVGRLFQKGAHANVNSDEPGQSIGGTTVFPDVSSVQAQDESAFATRLAEALAKTKAEQKRVAAAKGLSDLRAQAETNRQDRINELMERTKAYRKQQQYEAALGQLDALLAIDPLNDKALAEKQMVQYMINLRKQLGADQLSSQQQAEMLMGADEAGVPHADEITYPKEWREVLKSADGLPSASHFKVVPVNPWVMTDQDVLSTFALDVDTASYALCRRFIRGGYLPPKGAVRMEEFINAFDYAYPQRDEQPFTVYAEGTPSPFAPVGQNLTLLKVAVKARTVGRDQRRAANLVFVVDASASMGQADRLPLVQAAANQLVDKLAEADRVSLITCANDARLHLEAVPARQKDAIRDTINAIQPAGPTNLLAGLKLAYAMARKNFVAGQTNEVVLCSDGVANVGQTEAEAMLQEVAQDRKQAITLTCVGVGYGAYNDAFLEALANQGDGRYVFLDSSEQAQQALVRQLAASLENVASDARIQVQFNPNRVRRYRLIGYENRDIEDKRFRDDTINAGAVGSGQCSTALYELELVGSRESGMGVPPMQHRRDADATTEDADLGTVFVRYRNADSGQMEEISRPLAGSIVRRRSVEEDPRLFLAAGAARFAECLRQSEHAQNTVLPEVQRLLDQVSAALPLDRDVQELAALAHQAEGLPRAPEAATPGGVQ